VDQNTNSGRLFLAAVPDADTARRIHRLAGALIFFLGELPERVARIASEVAAEVRAPPFQVLFDRSVTFRGKPRNQPFVLTGDHGLDRLKSFRRTLGVAMSSKGWRDLAKKEFTPHVTLLYAERNNRLSRSAGQ
jgi:RNA 2',3'-cyclic 3'-phosphodiesterase